MHSSGSLSICKIKKNYCNFNEDHGLSSRVNAVAMCPSCNAVLPETTSKSNCESYISTRFARNIRNCHQCRPVYLETKPCASQRDMKGSTSGCSQRDGSKEDGLGDTEEQMKTGFHHPNIDSNIHSGRSHPIQINRAPSYEMAPANTMRMRPINYRLYYCYSPRGLYVYSLKDCSPTSQYQTGTLLSASPTPHPAACPSRGAGRPQGCPVP